MKYRLYENGTNDTSNVVMEVLKNRGVCDCNEYLNLTDKVVLPYSYLNNMDEAVDLFINHFERKSKIGVLVDEDVDGFCSASEMYLYIKRLDNDYPVKYIMHQRAKAHGLSGDIELPDDIELLIIPDAGTNDVEQCKKLNEIGIDILILDHHESEKDNPFALIVNNQMGERYDNKSLCGAGVVYKFLKALDDRLWNECADDFLDLFALGNISDVMDMRSYETRYLTDLGLKNIQNKFLKALIKAQEYSMNDIVNIHNIQWYITPVINAIIRIGSIEEKELVFRAFIEEDEFFEYKKRATKNNPAQTIQESIYDRAARFCKNSKQRQDKLRDKGLEKLSNQAKKFCKNPDETKILLVDATDVLHEGLTGVVAIKMAENFNKPVILLKRHRNERGEEVYGGSARNMNNSPIENLKDVINSTNVIKGQGHANAFGIVDLPIDKKEEATRILNDILKDVEYDATYLVDYIFDIYEVDVNTIMQLSVFDNIICQGIEEPKIAVENIKLSRSEFEIFGKKEDIISFTYNGIKYVQFKCKEGNQIYDFLQNAWDDNETVTFNIVGKPSINEYNGIRTPQVIILDNDIISTDNTETFEDEDEAW